MGYRDIAKVEEGTKNSQFLNMLRILLIGCLFFATGNGESQRMEMEEIVGFFNNLFNFMYGLGDQTNFYVEGNLEGVTGLSGRVKVGLTGPIGYIDNARISYPDSNTKLCSMELVINDGLTINSIEKSGMNLKLSQCHILTQFSISNITGVAIKPETVVVFGCNVKEADGTPYFLGPQVTQGLSKLLKERADRYLTHHYDSSDALSYDYFKHNNVTKEELEDIMDTVLIFS